jgi:hypothetical protein
MSAIVKTETAHEIMENVLIKGDLSKLTAEERNSYYRAVCASVGLNPLTKPLEYIVLNGKLRLYALKDCTDQLRSINNISVTDLTDSEREGVFVVKAKVANGVGRTDMSTGAVNIAGLKGENLANALMKAETKAKRRATLSICGLGLLDETEVDDIPVSQKTPAERSRVPSPSDTSAKASADPEPPQGPQLVKGGKDAANWAELYLEAMLTSGDRATVKQWTDANQSPLGRVSADLAKKISVATEKHLAFLSKTVPKYDPISSGPPSKTAKGEMPNIDNDYTAWVEYIIKRIAKTDVGDDMDALFDIINAENGLFPMDRDALDGARRERENEQAP